jgi:hypothetical protein
VGVGGSSVTVAVGVGGSSVRVAGGVIVTVSGMELSGVSVFTGKDTCSTTGLIKAQEVRPIASINNNGFFNLRILFLPIINPIEIGRIIALEMYTEL